MLPVPASPVNLTRAPPPPVLWPGPVTGHPAHPGHPAWVSKMSRSLRTHDRADPAAATKNYDELSCDLLATPVQLRNMATRRYLSVAPCDGGSGVDTWDRDDDTGRQRWFLAPVAGQPKTYTLANLRGRGECSVANFLSVPAEAAAVDVWASDDASGRQRWRFKSIGSKFMVFVSGGRKDDRLFLTALPEGGGVTLAPRDNSHAQRWRLRRVVPEPFVEVDDDGNDGDDESDDPPAAPVPPPSSVQVQVRATQVPRQAAVQLLKLTGLAEAQVDTILQLVSLPENGHPKWWQNYGFIKFLRDGRGYTATLFGACSGTGDLNMIFNELEVIKPGHPLLKYHDALRKKRGDDVKGIEPLLKLVPAAAEDPAWREAVWRVYVNLYWRFAAEFAEKKGACAQRPGPVLALAVSRGFMLDTAINHGAGMSSFADIMKRMPPGVRETRDELDWMHAFIDARYGMLKSGYQQLDTSGTGDRCKLWRGLLDDSNFALARPIAAYRGYWGTQLIA